MQSSEMVLVLQRQMFLLIGIGVVLASVLTFAVLVFGKSLLSKIRVKRPNQTDLPDETEKEMKKEMKEEVEEELEEAGVE